MAYDDGLAERVRNLLQEEHGVEEKKMFGGLTFMVAGHMACGAINDDLMVRVGADIYEESLAEPHARPMDFTGKPLKGMVYVAPEGYEKDADLARWVARGMSNARALPPKKMKKKKKKKKR